MASQGNPRHIDWHAKAAETSVPEGAHGGIHGLLGLVCCWFWFAAAKVHKDLHDLRGQQDLRIDTKDVKPPPLRNRPPVSKPGETKHELVGETSPLHIRHPGDVHGAIDRTR